MELFWVLTLLFLTAKNASLVAGLPSMLNAKHNVAGSFGEPRAHSLGGRPLVTRATSAVDVSGQHAFVPPNFNAGDQRGPCPALNSLANHGYIPHNGVTSFAEVIAAINGVFGMGLDLATILATMGTVWVGDPISLDPGFSIGTTTPNAENILGNLFGLLGTPQGLDGSHNFIEADSSNTREDLYVTGNVHSLVLSQFNEWMATSADGTFTMDLLAQRADTRFKETVAENPYFYYGPFTGMVARNAGFIFPGRLFANFSSENPDGSLTQDILQSFFAVYGEGSSLEYKEGWEAIPENWYRRSTDYSVVDLNLDLVDWVSQYPELASVGGNTGTVNSFTPLDLGDVTGGVFSAGNLLEGNHLMCLALEVVKTVSPNALDSLYATISPALNLIESAIDSSLLGCPELGTLTVGGTDFLTGIQNLFPGAARSGSVL